MKSATRYAEVAAFVTKDGSIIRELLHPSQHNVRAQSLAEAEIAIGQETRLHRHRVSEEIYYVLQGEGVMQLGIETFPVATADSICIPPGIPHKIRNTGNITLKLLCSCAPAYAHDDTELL